MHDDQRRTAALATALERFPAVADRVSRVYGLRLPRHLAVFHAFWASAAGEERSALSDLMLRPWGITDYFADNGLDLVARDGLDERLHARYRRDPAEFVTVLSGNSDGEHFGLWYDDPAALPAMITVNYARDSAETWVEKSPTLLGVLRARIDSAIADYGDDTGYGPLLPALAWFADADAAALQADGWEPPRSRAYGAIAPFPTLPPRTGNPRLAKSQDRLTAFRSDPAAAARWLTDAERDLAAGKPALALAIGAELHWLDTDTYRDQGLPLLVGAYRTLGRHALAEIATLHATHRDLDSVQVLT
ncbi:ADP-ribosylation family protein [Winogradskya humida]|uniref:SMI1/KNR4 family protein SUKH-1 n=1 Tax=Winogradskya humida TaxID=113566 RepID=A0ABQ4A5S9_9ACTN|nr:ADP-ribosylation family protein [Actinoplanes humidus]GIE26188.1 hypothetical protein Ahu01nite_092900 [Actinoplanes humidus]